jgi:hypothetical protein
LATVSAVAAVAHTLVGGLSWAAAFTLGAIVSPTDPLAATAIARRLGVPRRLVTVLEGESLVNDASALVAYRLAVGAVVAGSFTLWAAGVQFVSRGIGGVAIGLAVGWLIAEARRRIEDPVVEIVLSVVTGYAAYLPAELMGASRVLGRGPARPGGAGQRRGDRRPHRLGVQRPLPGPGAGPATRPARPAGRRTGAAGGELERHAGRGLTGGRARLAAADQRMAVTSG